MLTLGAVKDARSHITCRTDNSINEAEAENAIGSSKARMLESGTECKEHVAALSNDKKLQ